MENLIRHVESPDVPRAGVGLGDFGEDVGWCNDGEGGQLRKSGEDLEPPWRVVVTAWTREVGYNALDVYIDIVRGEE